MFVQFKTTIKVTLTYSSALTEDQVAAVIALSRKGIARRAGVEEGSVVITFTTSGGRRMTRMLKAVSGIGACVACIRLMPSNARP